MGKIYKIYKDSFNLDENQGKEFLDLVADLLDMEEVKGLAQYEQHLDIDRLQHVKSVAYMSYVICKKYNLDFVAAARAGLLHDLFYYDWKQKDDGSHRLHGYRHPGFALKNAKEITNLSKKEENIIKRHMWPLTPTPPKYLESYVVTMCDKYSATVELIYASNQKIKMKFKRKDNI